MRRFTLGIVSESGHTPRVEGLRRRPLDAPRRLRSLHAAWARLATQLLLCLAFALVSPLIGGKSAFAQSYSLPFTFIPTDAQGRNLRGNWVHSFLTIPQAYEVDISSDKRHANHVKFRVSVLNPSGTFTSWSDIINATRLQRPASDGYYYDVARVVESYMLDPVLSPSDFNKHWTAPYTTWEPYTGPYTLTMSTNVYWDLTEKITKESYTRNVPAGEVWINIRTRFAANIRGDVLQAAKSGLILSFSQKDTLKRLDNYRLVVYFARWKPASP